MADTRTPRFFPACDLRISQLLSLVGNLHFLKRRRRDDDAQNFRNVIRSALLHREERGTIILRRNLQQPADCDLIIAARRSRRREDQVRLTKSSVRVLLAIDHIKIPGTDCFYADSQTISLNQSRRRRDWFREIVCESA